MERIAIVYSCVILVNRHLTYTLVRNLQSHELLILTNHLLRVDMNFKWAEGKGFVPPATGTTYRDYIDGLHLATAV